MRSMRSMREGITFHNQGPLLNIKVMYMQDWVYVRSRPVTVTDFDNGLRALLRIQE